MNCRNVRRVLRTASPPTQRDQARAHLDGCAACRREVGIERLAAGLIRAYGECGPPDAGHPQGSDPYFFARLRARIDARRSEAGLMPWEAALTSARGWLLGFGAVTALLFAVSLFSLGRQAEPAPDLAPQVLALPGGSDSLLMANSESLSQDAVLYTLVAPNEDQDHERK